MTSRKCKFFRQFLQPIQGPRVSQSRALLLYNKASVCWRWWKHLTDCFPENYRLTGRGGKETGGNKILKQKRIARLTGRNFRNKMRQWIVFTKKNEFRQLLVFPSFLLTWDRSHKPGFGQVVERPGSGHDKLFCCWRKKKTPYLTSFDRHDRTRLVASFASVLTHVFHSYWTRL